MLILMQFTVYLYRLTYRIDLMQVGKKYFLNTPSTKLYMHIQYLYVLCSIHCKNLA